MRITARVKKQDHGGALPWAVTIMYDGALHVCGARLTHAAALAHALREVGLAPCECVLLPEEFHTTHYGLTEPGSTHEFNPDCPAHGYDMADDGPTLEPMEAP